MEIEWLVLRYGSAIYILITRPVQLNGLFGHFPVHLVRRSKQQKRTIARKAGTLENIKCPIDVRLEVATRIIDRCRDRNLRSKLIYLVRVLAGSLDSRSITDVSDCHSKPSRPTSRLLQQLQVVLNAASRQIVEYVHARIRLKEQVARKVRPYKTCTAKDQYRSLL